MKYNHLLCLIHPKDPMVWSARLWTVCQNDTVALSVY